MLRLPHSSLLAGTAALLVACAGPGAESASTKSWTVGATPQLTITDSAAPTGHELNGVFSAIRLRDHSILVANAGAWELALFDSTGQFRRAVGRKGQGPGEYRGPIAVFRWRADSLAVYDGGTYRWTILDSALSVGRVTPPQDSTFLQPTWLYLGAIVTDGLLDPIPTWVVDALTAERRHDPEYRRLIRARRDDLGALWIRDSADTRKWIIYAGTASAQGTAILPTGLEPLDIGEDFVLGVVRDSLGVEGLRMFELRRPALSPIPDGPAAPPIPRDSIIKSALPGLMMAQEMYYSNHAKYASDAKDLTLQAPFPAHLFVLDGDNHHWMAIGIRVATGATCGVSIGWPAPLGWVDGGAFCGR